MTETFFLLTSTMSTDRQRIRQLKYHINQLLSELRRIESDDHHLQPLNLSINSQLTTLSQEQNCCPYVSSKQKAAAVLHSTTNQEYRKKPKAKFLFAASALATSTPKSSPNQNRLISLKPFHTSTPRRSKRHSTALAMPPNNIIPLKRLLYNRDYDQHKRRHSAVPFSKRSILPRLHPIEENPQWI